MQNSLTCISCRVIFNIPELQREHYKTEWHRYNLKRKIAELPPITLENFDTRITEQNLNDQKAKANKEECNKYCDICIKSFSSSNSYESHLRSKRHKDLEAGIGKDTRRANARDNRRMHIKALERKQLKSENDPMETNEKTKNTIPNNLDTEEDFDGLGLEQCLFCENIEDSLEDNLKHMTLVHSFFLPDANYIVDLEGLINYLGLKVGDGHMCLWCNDKGKMFQSILAAQRHMVDKGHCKILHDADTLVEFSDFYDYRSSYPDYETRKSDEEDEDDEEDISGGEDAVIETNHVNDEDYQLILPSGSSIGHRSLMRYYKQKLKVTNNKIVNTSKISKLLSQYKALGWTGTTGVVAQKCAKDLKFMERNRHKYRMKMGMKNNKLLTTHFRNQVFCYF